MTVDPAAGSPVPVPESAPVSSDVVGASSGTIADLADTLVSVTENSSGPDTRPTDGAVLRYGKITAVGTGTNALRAQTDATGAAWVAYDVSYAAQVGDLVYLFMQGPVVHIGGQLGGTQPTPPPVGTLIAFAGGTVPLGWVSCAGAALSRTTYAVLFGVVGTLYGAGDGSTTFNVPNLVGRIPIGSGGSFTRGATGGAATVTLSVAQMPNHTHGMNHSHSGGSHSHDMGHGHSGGSHSHSVSASGSQTFAAGAAGGTSTSVANNASGSTGSASISVGSYSGSTDSASVSVGSYSGSTDDTGSGSSVNVMNPWLAVSYILRALP